MLKT
jgi:hypothetical protein